MKKNSLCFVISTLVAGFLFLSCAEKKPQGPPQELLDKISAVEAIYQEASQLSPTPQDTSEYNSIMALVRQDMGAGDYKSAEKRVRLARLVAIRLHASLLHRELMKYNPPHTLTYHYRQQTKASEDAEAKGDIEGAIEAAEEAKRQAELALELQIRCLEKAGEELAGLKKEIEVIYRPALEMVNLYWDTLDVIETRDCNRTQKMVEELKRRVEYTKVSTIMTQRTFIVTSPPEFVRVYGDPIMYEEVTPRGLSGQLTRVQVGQPVIFIRSMMVARDKTYYYVKDLRTGIEGWMAEERVWPDRALQH